MLADQILLLVLVKASPNRNNHAITGYEGGQLVLTLHWSHTQPQSTKITIKRPALDDDHDLLFSYQPLILSDSTANLSLKADRDPNFFALFRNHQPELSHDSVYINFLGLLKELAFQRIQDFMPGRTFSDRRYNDVQIAIESLPPLTFATAMWGLEDSLSHMFLHGNFKSCETHLFFDYGPGISPIKIGETRVRPTAFSTDSTRNLTVPVNSTELSTNSVTSAKNAIPLAPVPKVSLDRPPPHWEIAENFDGPSLTQDQAIWLACEMIIKMAELRPEYLHGEADITDHEVTLMIKPAQMPETIGPPYFFYDQIIYLVHKIAKYMIKRNIYRAGQFVLKFRGQPVGFGEFKVLDRASNVNSS
ncbi:MAG: hypothetical protein Q9191_000618 [Dirinaria sp. TL-2023a]